jgi:hypothetical protein
LVGAALLAACSGEDTDAESTSGTTTTTEEENMCPTDTCPSACGEGLTCCNGVCVDLMTDIDNCNVCCHQCPTQYTACVAGECEQ